MPPTRKVSQAAKPKPGSAEGAKGGAKKAKKKSVASKGGSSSPLTNGVGGAPGTPPDGVGKPGSLKDMVSSLSQGGAPPTKKDKDKDKLNDPILNMLNDPTAYAKDKNKEEEEQEDKEPTEEELAEQQRKRERLAKVLAGHLKDLPPLSKKVMRIFTSSTFTGNCLTTV